MQIQYINEMLDIPELQVRQIRSMVADELHIEAIPRSYKQCCPLCKSDQNVIRKGSNGMRTVRHLPVFAKKPFCMCLPSDCPAPLAKPDLDGSMNLSDPSSATAGFFVSILSNKRSDQRLHIALVCSNYLPVPYNACITRLFRWSVNASRSTCGPKRKKCPIWF